MEGFGAPELRYLKRVETALLVTPRKERAGLLGMARRHFGERPPADSYDDLVDELGPPGDYARQLMDDEGVDPQPPRWRRLVARARSREAIGLVALLALLGLVAGWFALRWFREEPTIENNCAGAFSDDGVPIEIQSLATGADERRISFVEGAEVGIGFCLTTSHTVEVIDVTVPDDGLFVPTGVQISVDNETFRPFEPFRVLDHSEADGPGDPRVWWHVRVVGELDGCERYMEGGGTHFDTATITYLFRGRIRTTDLDLLTTYFFDGGSDDVCPGRSAEVGS